MSLPLFFLSWTLTRNGSYWSKLTTDGDIVWGPDPLLTALGVVQAQEAAKAWAREREYGVPEVEVWFLSPLKRALDTFKAMALSEDPEDRGRRGAKGLILEVCLPYPWLADAFNDMSRSSELPRRIRRAHMRSPLVPFAPPHVVPSPDVLLRARLRRG